MKSSIVTFNIRYVYDDIDGINNFIHRAGFIFDKIEKEKPDIIGFQEVTPNILKFLERMMSDYFIIGHPNNVNYTGSGNFTAFKKDTYRLLGFETRWLSPTPFVIASRFENQSICTRACNMIVLKNLKTGMPFRVFNTHLDHISDEAKFLGIKSVFEFIDEMNSKLKMPYVLMGDFNSVSGSDTIEYCSSREDVYDVTSKIPMTCHSYGTSDLKIDYIYMTDEFASKVTDVCVWDDFANGIYLSDHYPICAKLEF